MHMYPYHILLKRTRFKSRGEMEPASPVESGFNKYLPIPDSVPGKKRVNFPPIPGLSQAIEDYRHIDSSPVTRKVKYYSLHFTVFFYHIEVTYIVSRAVTVHVLHGSVQFRGFERLFRFTRLGSEF